VTATSAAFTDRLADYDRLARDAARTRLTGSGLSAHLVHPAVDYLDRGGKGLRPALCLATCEAFGGRVEDALPSAVALELLHTGFLVHDDVEDGSELRRGAPTLHRRYGLGLAVNAGDGLAVAALGTLRDNDRLIGRRLSARVWAEFDFMARQTVDGQACELGWQRENRTDLTPDDYLDLIMKKTCWYTTVLPLRVGALVGSRGSANLEPMMRFGFALGAAFQIRDDVLNLTGEPSRYGKEPLGDLREGKRTLVLVHLLAAASPDDRARVVRFLGLAPAQRDDDAVAAVARLLHQYGSIAFADEFARGIARSASEAFQAAFAGVPDSPARQFVAQIVPFMVERDR
jgi:geranylgeranyl diphosphate synthase type II